MVDTVSSRLAHEMSNAELNERFSPQLDSSDREEIQCLLDLSLLLAGSLPRTLACASERVVRAYLIEAGPWPATQPLARGMLLVHALLRCGAPQHAVHLVHGAHQDGARHADDEGRLPLHHAVRHRAAVATIALLVDAHPAAVRVADASAQLPIHYARAPPACAADADESAGEWSAAESQKVILLLERAACDAASRDGAGAVISDSIGDRAAEPADGDDGWIVAREPPPPPPASSKPRQKKKPPKPHGRPPMARAATAGGVHRRVPDGARSSETARGHPREMVSDASRRGTTDDGPTAPPPPAPPAAPPAPPAIPRTPEPLAPPELPTGVTSPIAAEGTVPPPEPLSPRPPQMPRPAITSRRNFRARAHKPMLAAAAVSAFTAAGARALPSNIRSRLPTPGRPARADDVTRRAESDERPLVGCSE